MPEGRQEADELHHHDQRPRGGLGHAEPVEHLAGLEPAIGLDRLLRHVGEHGIGAAEGDDGHLREEDADIAEDVDRCRAAPAMIAITGTSQSAKPDRRDPQRTRDRRPRMLGQFLAEQAFGRAPCLRGAMPAADLKRARSRARADESR